MERIRRILRRKARQVAPKPAVTISQPSQEESGPSVPAGGEEARGQGEERSCIACCRRRKTAAPLADPEAPSGPKWRWPSVQLWRREPGEGRSRRRQLWGFLRRKPRSQELRPRAQQEPSTTMVTEGPCASPTLAPEEPPARLPRGASLTTKEPLASPTLATKEPPASPTLAIEEPPASPEQELSDCGATNTSSSAYSCGASSSSLVADRAEQLRFLHAVPRLCFSAQKQGRDTLEPPVSKAALVESIAVSGTPCSALGRGSQTWEEALVGPE
ncbi:uncharacterized protein LOC120388839 [Mauremys reevesii]|uniref:uncharacterized protein LOC120388839 n=1 Tax=Mauremys reevesii TaxID=260615 RepID=UPI00193F0466|nr:uncharacterized protein LOC120388839 [Mauremys reevesii]